VTGCSDAQSLAADTGLRPLVASLRGLTAAHSIYATNASFPDPTDIPASLDAELHALVDELITLGGVLQPNERRSASALVLLPAARRPLASELMSGLEIVALFVLSNCAWVISYKLIGGQHIWWAVVNARITKEKLIASAVSAAVYLAGFWLLGGFSM
jgi:hypothetical protein